MVFCKDFREQGGYERRHSTQYAVRSMQYAIFTPAMAGVDAAQIEQAGAAMFACCPNPNTALAQTGLRENR